jgi:hypothetical protein
MRIAVSELVRGPFHYGFSFFDQFMIVIALWVPYLGGVLFLNALNEKICSMFRATVISMASLGTRASFCLLGPLVGYGIDRWGFPPVLSALGILFAVVFVFLLLPLVLRDNRSAPGRRTESVIHFRRLDTIRRSTWRRRIAPQPDPLTPPGRPPTVTAWAPRRSTRWPGASRAHGRHPGRSAEFSVLMPRARR